MVGGVRSHVSSRSSQLAAGTMVGGVKRRQLVQGLATGRRSTRRRKIGRSSQAPSGPGAREREEPEEDPWDEEVEFSHEETPDSGEDEGMEDAADTETSAVKQQATASSGSSRTGPAVLSCIC